MKRKPKPQVIHRRIRELRIQLGLDQADIGKKCKVDKSTVSHWERGVSSPTRTTLPKVAAALGVSIADLYTESEAA